MKVIIAGSRTIHDLRLVVFAVAASGFDVTVVISGKCPKGVDCLGEAWAKNNGVPVDPYPANWKKYGITAGGIRNAEMSKVGDALIAIHDGVSKGTANMINFMKLLNKPCYILVVPGLRYDPAIHKLEAPNGKVH